MQFRIPLPAKPQGSKKAFIINGRPVLVEASNDLKKHRTVYSELIRLDAEAAEWVTPDKDTPISVTIEFVFLKPKTVKRTHMTTIPDIDKIARFCLDALVNAGVLHDDRQIVNLNLSKRYGDRTITIIDIGVNE